MERVIIDITANKYEIRFEGVEVDKQNRILETIAKLIHGIIKKQPEEID